MLICVGSMSMKDMLLFYFIGNSDFGGNKENAYSSNIR